MNTQPESLPNYREMKLVTFLVYGKNSLTVTPLVKVKETSNTLGDTGY